MLKIHTVLGVSYIGKGSEGLRKRTVEIQTENKIVIIPARVKWLSNLGTVKDREEISEICHIIGGLGCEGDEGSTETYLSSSMGGATSNPNATTPSQSATTEPESTDPANKIPCSWMCIETWAIVQLQSAILPEM